jgi:hypothetical protein
MGSDSTISRSGRQDPPLPDTDLARASGSNFLSNISLEPGCTGYLESLVRLQAEAAGDDFLLDLGGAAEDGQNADILGRLLITAMKADALDNAMVRSLMPSAARAGHGSASGSSRPPWVGSRPGSFRRPPSRCGSLVPGAGSPASGGCSNTGVC